MLGEWDGPAMNLAAKMKVEVNWSLGAECLIAAEAYPRFCSLKQLQVFLLPGWDASLLQVTPPHFVRFSNNLLVPTYTPGWRVRTSWSGDKYTNQEATILLQNELENLGKSKLFGQNSYRADGKKGLFYLSHFLSVCPKQVLFKYLLKNWLVLAWIQST